MEYLKWVLMALFTLIWTFIWIIWFLRTFGEGPHRPHQIRQPLQWENEMDM